MKKGVCPFCGKKVDTLIMFRGDVVGCRYCGIHSRETNADKLRSMSDDELAIYLSSLFSINYVTGADPHFWADYLKQEATP